MKKAIALMLTLIMFVLCSMPVFASDGQYGARVSINGELQFDADTVDYYKNYFTISINIYDIEKYEYGHVIISYNTQLIEYMDGIFTQLGHYKHDFAQTSDGVWYEASFNADKFDRNNPDYKETDGFASLNFRIKGAGMPDFKISAYAVTTDGEKIDLEVDCDMLSKEIIDVTPCAKISMPEVLYEKYDDASADMMKNPDFSLWCNINSAEKLSVCKITVSYNNRVLDAMPEFANYPEIETGYSLNCEETENSVIHTITWKDEYDRIDDYGTYFHIPFDVASIGEHNIEITAEAYDLDGNIVDMNVKYMNEVYPSTVDFAELEEVKVDDAYAINYYAVFEGEIAVQDILSKVDGETAVIENYDGEMLKAEDNVSNYSRIVTLYKGYEVDFMVVCIKYDVNCDGEVTAADARLALRHAAQIEYLKEFDYTAADIDGTRGVTAADARLILRKVAQLD